jgi:hypothetical protein
MKNLLDEIYDILNGGVIIEGDSPRIINHTENKLCKRLKGKEKDLFYDYITAYSEFNALTAVESFKVGFKTGFDFSKELKSVRVI